MNKILAAMAIITAMTGCTMIPTLIDLMETPIEDEVITPVPIEYAEITEEDYPWKGKLHKDITKDGNKRSNINSINYKQTQRLDTVRMAGDALLFEPKMTYWTAHDPGKDPAIMGFIMQGQDNNFYCCHFATFCPLGRGGTKSLAIHEMNAHSTMDMMKAKRIWVYIHNYKGSRTNFKELRLR